MINIVTIDFDFIMNPSISFYNDLVDEETGLDDERFPFVNIFPADLNRYEYLTRFLMKSKESDIYFISNHENIVDYIKKLPKDEEYHVINIDHHHDIGYDINFKRPLFNAEVGNWVKYLKDNKLISKYTWIRNDNSDPIPEEGERYIDEEYDIAKYNLNLLAKDTDIIVVCGSLTWIPPIYHPLFDTWQSIFEELNGKDYLVDDY